jgi:WD40-like Beta Propeller Repeat
MNDNIDFDRFVADQFAQVSGGVPPARFVDDILIEARRMRPLPRWLATIKEPPMRVSSRVAVGSPMARVAFLVILLAILSALTAGSIVAGASLLVSPAPPAIVGNGLIAYDAGGDIWVVDPDGTEPRQLTSGPSVEHGATWSRDGTKIAYWATETASAPDTLVIADADGSHPRTIATHEPGSAADLAGERDLDWSPDGRHVAYSLCTVADPVCDERVFVAATDGSGASLVGDEGLTAWRPRWSPDGSLLAFAANRDGAEQGVYLMAPDGTDVRRISAVVDDDQYGFFSVSWSPDGTSIATRAQGSIWLLPAGAHDPADEVALVQADAVVPTWSPDGSQVAYIDLGASLLRVTPAAGGDLADLGSLTVGGYAWAPDGTSIVVNRCYSGGCGFEIVDPVAGDHVAGIQVSAPGLYPSWQRRTS